MDLEKLLQGTDYESRLNIIKAHSEIVFKKDVPIHKNYTLHGIDHCKSVISKLNSLVEGIDQKNILTVPEVFYLLSSVYLHDVGMLVTYPDDEARANEISIKKGVSYSKEELIRDEHNSRSGRYITEHLVDLNLDHVESACVELICKGHRIVDLNSDDYNDRFVDDKCIRVRLLSALIRLADELDVSYTRAPKKLMDLLVADMPEFSQLQWLKHYYTSGVLISFHDVNGKRKIFIGIQTQYPDFEKGKKITDELIIKPIQKILITVDRIFLEFGLNINLSTPEIFLNENLDAIPKKIYDKYIDQEYKISYQIPQTKGFIGRSSELNILLNLLDSNIIVIEGIAGIGKTYLAAKFAEKIKEEYEIYWYGNLNEFTAVKSVLTQISLFLKENEKPTLYNSINLGYETDILIDILRNELKANKLAIFFDNYQKAENELNHFFEQLISIELSKIILITREKPDFYNILYERNNTIGKIKVEPWSFSDTVDMFGERFLETPDVSTLKKIHERLHGHPQYLNLFCILSQKAKPSELLTKLPLAEEDARSYLENQVYNSLKEDEQTLIQIISVYRVPEKIDAFNIGNKSKNVEITLNNLINKFLVNEVGSDKYFVHEIISSYCSNDIKKIKTLQNYHSNAAKYYLLKDDNAESLLEASYHYIKSGEKEKSDDIFVNNSQIFIDKGFWNKIEEPLKTVMNNLSKKRHDRKAISKLGYIHLRIGDFYTERGDFRLALEHANECSDCFSWSTKKYMFSLYNLFGDIYRHMGEIDESMKYYEKCLDLAKKSKNEYFLAVANANLGTIHCSRLEYEKGLELYSMSNSFFEMNNYKKNVATSYSNIAITYYILEDFNKAYTFIKKSINSYKELGATYWEVSRYIIYASFIISDPAKKGYLDDALFCLEKNVEILSKIGDLRTEAAGYLNIGLVHKINKNPQISMYYFEKAKICFDEIDEKDQNFTDISSLCEIYINLYHFDKAEKTIKYFLSKTNDSFFYKPAFQIYLSLISFLIGNDNEAFAIIEELTQKESRLYKKCNWNFKEIMLTIEEKLEPYKYIIISDLMSFSTNKTKFPLIRLNHVRVVREEPGSHAEVFHPFVGNKKISKEDIFFKNILNVLCKGETIIDVDSDEIMGVERNLALMTLGFLYNKGYINFLEISSNNLEITLNEIVKKVIKSRK